MALEREDHVKTFGRAATVTSIVLRPVRRVVVVGAYECAYGGTNDDSMDFTRLIDYLKKQGVVVEPKLSIDVINLHKGRDYLLEAPSCDLLFVTDVPGFRIAKYMEMQRPSRDRIDSYLNGVFDRAISFEHYAAKWQEAVRKSHPAFVATFGGGKHVNTRDLLTKGYEEILPSPRQALSPKPSVEAQFGMLAPHQFFTGPALRFGLPTPWLGLNIRSDVRAALEETLPSDSALSQRICELEVLTKPRSNKLSDRFVAWLGAHLAR